jgi:demethylmenaquinone methyltransferase/2-methoxy-6-polyprenyl-1,4-benzoquinol methylase
MLSYVYMKILESRPRRYDTAIRWLSLGQADRARREIVARWVRAGDRVLDVGTGTGTLALLAAGRGAEVTGIDVSAGMLREAERKRHASAAGHRVRFIETGVAEMDSGLEEGFDLVTAFLVMSELSGDERRWMLAQAHRLLGPGGRIAVADETRPDGAGRRALHGLVRLPLAVATFAVTQTSTRPVEGLERLVAGAGFEVDVVETRAMGSFVLVGARKA